MSDLFTEPTRFPFDASEAKRRQEEAAKGIGLPVDVSVQLPEGIKMDFVLIPPGGFMMGSPEEELKRLDDEYLHQVRITKPFYMAKYPCTQEQWQAINDNNPSLLKDNPRNPVEMVSWNDINDILLPAIQKHAPKGMTFRFPTEAQWEYACRAGTSTPFHFGATITPDQVNYDGNYPYGNASKGAYRRRSLPVGSFSPNAWGLHDMHGNVDEWCMDWHNEGFYRSSPTEDPVNTVPGKHRVLRGGSWSFYAWDCRSATRNCCSPDSRHDLVGVRLSLELP